MRPKDDARLLEDMATLVHGAAASLNLLGLVFNVRKRNWFDVGMHAVGLVYHTGSALNHRAQARHVATGGRA